MFYFFDWNGDFLSNVLTAADYNVTNDMSGFTIWAAYSQIDYGHGFENPTAGKVTVQHVDGQYRLIYDLETASGKFKAEYNGRLGSLNNPN